MTAARLRRFALLALAGAGLFLLIASLAGGLVRAGAGWGEARAAAASAREIVVRVSQIETRLAPLETARQGRVLRAPDGAAAAEAMRADIAAAFASGGEMLSLRASGEGPDIVAAAWFWRGDEADIRTALETLARDADGLDLVRLQLRQVSDGGEVWLEAHGEARRRWEATP